MSTSLTLEFDGGSRGNPGPAGIGVVLRDADGVAVYTLGRFIGTATNNVAEYRALITGLQQAVAMGAAGITIRGDSELVIKQLNGQYRVKHPDMKVLHGEASLLLRKFASVKIVHNLREKNALADKLANLAMDRRVDVSDAGGDSPAPRPTVVAATPLTEHECPDCGCAIRVITPPQHSRTKPTAFRCTCGFEMSPRVR